MSIVVEAPNENYSIQNENNVSLFLAGETSHCEDWQSEMIKELKDIKNLIIYNPRKKQYDVKDPLETQKQIVWEFNHLNECDLISFWFSKETINPIVLYELGMWGNSREGWMYFVGVDIEYERYMDVVYQTYLANPNIKIVNTIKDLSQQIKNYMKNMEN